MLGKHTGRTWNRALRFVVIMAVLSVLGVLFAELATPSSGKPVLKPSRRLLVTRTLTVRAVREKSWGQKDIQADGIGALSLARYGLSDAVSGRHLGLAYERCTDTFDNQVLCDWSFAFGQGQTWDQITQSGLVSLFDQSHVVPITGGTGAYSGVTGEASWTFNQSGQAAVTMTIHWP